MSIKASAYDQGKYFKAADLPAEKKLKIKNVTEEVVGEAREKKLVVWFFNDNRGLVLNRVSNRTLRTAFGDECDNWPGKTIAMYPTTDNFRGQQVGVVRVRTAPTNGGHAPQKADPPTPTSPPPAANVAEKTGSEDEPW